MTFSNVKVVCRNTFTKYDSYRSARLCFSLGQKFEHHICLFFSFPNSLINFALKMVNKWNFLPIVDLSFDKRIINITILAYTIMKQWSLNNMFSKFTRCKMFTSCPRNIRNFCTSLVAAFKWSCNLKHLCLTCIFLK